MPIVEPDDVDVLAAGNTEATVSIITAMAKAYTRGHGFDDNGDPNEDVAAVIATASVRFLGNPTQASRSQAMGEMSEDMRSRGFDGWTLAELFVLNRYRKRAM